MPDSPRSFTDIVRSRRSVRGFLPDPVPAADIRAVLQDAQRAPSNCNTQPWQVHIVSGERREALSAELLEADRAGRTSPDFSFDYADFGDGSYLQRARDQGAAYYGSLGVERSDTEGRHEASLRNLEFFGAPHVALLFLPRFGDGVRVASDVGMYAQTFLLALEARGLAGIPQTMLGFYADTVRESLGVKEDMKLLFGISFGSADPKGPSSEYRMDRVPLAESVVAHDTPGILEQTR